MSTLFVHLASTMQYKYFLKLTVIKYNLQSSDQYLHKMRKNADTRTWTSIFSPLRTMDSYLVRSPASERRCSVAVRSTAARWHGTQPCHRKLMNVHPCQYLDLADIFVSFIYDMKRGRQPKATRGQRRGEIVNDMNYDSSCGYITSMFGDFWVPDFYFILYICVDTVFPTLLLNFVPSV